MIKRLLLSAGAVWLNCMVALAAPDDVKCTGVLVNEEGEPIIGATISIPGTKIVATTDIDGTFTISAPKGTKVHINYIGYKPMDIPAETNLGQIAMDIESQMLQDVVVTQSIARTRRTPVAVSAVDAATIETKLGTQELPEVLKTTPGVWATKDGGGFGDAKISVRGFKSQNTATMVNGVPVNDMEWGGIYWSNWSGLGDVTSQMQVQRGLGATIISSPSFGGTINMITKGLDAKKGGTAWYGLGNDNSMNYGISFSTGLMKNGWAVTFLGSHKTGDGYIQGTEFDSYIYFLNVTKRINESNQISLTVTGAPQTHFQRNKYDGLTVEGWQDVANFMPKGQAYRYNATYGLGLNGERKTSAYNYYNKPVAMLNHTWQINQKSTLSSVIYASIGTGGGYSGQAQKLNGVDLRNYWNGAYNGALQWNTIDYNGVTYNLRHGNGMFAYDQIQLLNQASTQGSLMAMSSSVNNHEWYGAVSNYKNELTEDLTVTAGVDLRYYYGKHTNEIVDLYNGQYFLDVNRSATNNRRTFATEAEKLAYQNQKLGVGDIVYRNWDSRILQEGIYAQGEYQMLDKQLTFVLAGAVNANTYTRWEKFYMNPEDGKSPTKTFWAGNVKGGANYNINRYNNVFFNAGYITRAPYLQYGVFVSPANSNAINPDTRNEKVTSIELGYEFHSPKFTAQLNGYYTYWKDRTLITTGTSAWDGERYTATMNGVDSRYMGIELNFVYKPVKAVEFSGMFTISDNTWQNAPVGYFYNSQGQALSNLGDRNTPWTVTSPLAEDHLNACIDQKGVKVGGAAQITGALGAQVKPFKGMRVGADWTFNAHNYSDFSLNNSNSVSLSPGQTLKISNPWCIPFGNQLDVNASYNFPITEGVRCTFSANVYNVFNNYYIMDAFTDYNTVGSWQNAFRVFYSYGRNFSLRAKIYF